MTTARTLQPEDQLAHYRVVGPLGTGGMGEVYLAQDQTLERNVALKVLPQELTRSEERVRRFVQEAKSASSLNHPNIITIYEIGQDAVRSASGESSTGSVQYISMELVSGKTLGAKIHEEKTDLRTLLGYLAQAAEGIAKAHAAGIVHRDLKPGNIMVSDDGFAKVLDFGLAKLTEKRSSEASATAMTEIGEQTAEGAVLGTVHYMSPEQVQGRSVDHRSDVFSFGCILYEAATRQRPFVADSNVETMHQILHDKPRPIEEINPSVPAELRRLIRRCLNKAPDQRLQSMKDVAIELREIADEYDALSASATSATTGSGSMAPVAPRGRRVPLAPVIAGAAVVVAAALFFGLRGREGAPPTPPNPMQTMSLTTQTSRGNVTDCNISPDGRYIAYIVTEGGQFGMYVRQVATGSDIEVMPMSDRIVESPVFSPDGNYLFYLARDPEHPLYRTLYRMASLGGPPEKKAFDVDSRVSFSPDGTQFVFSRGYPQDGRTAIFVMPLDGGKEREVASVQSPEAMTADACWSPDGKTIATVALNPPPASVSHVVTFDVESGKRTDVLSRKQAFYFGVAWMNQGRDLLVTGVDIGMGFTNQVFMVSYPGGKVRRITNDFNQYQAASASSAGDLIAAVRTTALLNLWTVGMGDKDAATQLTRATSTETSPVNFCSGNNTVYYSMVREHKLSLFAQPADGGSAHLISTPVGHVTQTRSGGNVIVFELYNEGEQHVWRIGTDGSGVRRLAQTSGENLVSISPDGRWAAFTASDSAQGIWIASTEREEARMVSRAATRALGWFSSDSKRILVSEFEQSGGLLKVAYRSIPCEGDGDRPVASPPQTAINVQWLPDGSGICYMDRADPARNVFSLRFGSDTPVRVTRYTDQPVKNYQFSPDGRRLVVVRQLNNADNVWVSDASGGNPRQLTTFTGLSVFNIDWTSDSGRLVMSVGNATRDVVLIRDFQ